MSDIDRKRVGFGPDSRLPPGTTRRHATSAEILLACLALFLLTVAVTAIVWCAVGADPLVSRP